MSVTLGGQAVIHATITIPSWGVWWIDAETSGGDDLSGSVTLDAPGAELSCAVVHGAQYAGRGRYRCAGGAGGWGTVLSARGYSNDAGVKLSTVIGDAAASAGETIGTVAADRIGSHWARPAGPASCALNLTQPRNWYVDDDGVTQIGQRAEVDYTGSATLIDSEPDRRSVTIGVNSLDQLRPGVRYDGGNPARDVIVRIDASTIRVTLLRDAETSARVEALRVIIDSLYPQLRYGGVYEYRVVSQEGERLHLQVVRSSSGLPDLARVPVRMTTGVRADHALGSLVLVAFIGGDPGRPCVVAGDDSSSAGWTPTSLDLVGDGDTVALGSEVDARLGALYSAISGAAVVPTDGGAAFKSNVLLALSGPPLWPLPTVGSQKVNVEP